jgi:hypothetical protein
MKTLQRIGPKLLTGMAISCGLVATAFAQADDLVGTWECGLSINDPASGASVNADFETTYDSDGSYAREGQLKISIAALQLELTVGMDEAGSWRVIDSQNIGETASELTLSSTSEMPSQIEQMILQQMQSESSGVVGQEEVAEIVSLTASTMELRSSDGAEMACNKA